MLPSLHFLRCSRMRRRPGQVDSASITEELDADFFLWLLYRLDGGGHVHAGLSISEIMAINSKNLLGRSRFNDGAGPDRPDMMVLVAGGSGQFGPAKVALTHTKAPPGYFELELHQDAGFVVLRDSSYDDEDLADMPKEELGRRMVEDVWQVVLPTLRFAYKDDTDWFDTERDAFKARCKSSVVSVLSR